MPKPKANETEQEFISRCMGYEDMQKYDQKQRTAICYSYWKNKEKTDMKNKKIERISPYVKELSNQTGKSIEEIDKLWSKAKEIAVETYGIQEKDFNRNHYEFILGTVKNMLGFNEKISLVLEFVKSGKSAKEFIREATVKSADFPKLQNDDVIKKDNEEEDGVEEACKDEKDIDKKENVKYNIEKLKEFPIKEVYEMEEGITMEITLPNGQQRFIRAKSIEEAKKDGWAIE